MLNCIHNPPRAEPLYCVSQSEVACSFRYKRRFRKLIRYATELTITSDMSALEPDEKWEISRSSIVMGTKLGEGAFGEGYQAEALGSTIKCNVSQVAVKSLKPQAAVGDKVRDKQF